MRTGLATALLLCLGKLLLQLGDLLLYRGELAVIKLFLVFVSLLLSVLQVPTVLRGAVTEVVSWMISSRARTYSPSCLYPCPYSATLQPGRS